MKKSVNKDLSLKYKDHLSQIITVTLYAILFLNASLPLGTPTFTNKALCLVSNVATAS